MLSESTLQTVLAKSDLLPSDKVLCCLAFEPDKPKRVKDIRVLAARLGVAEFKNLNVMALLGEMSKYTFKTASGWELKADGLAHVEALLSVIDKPSRDSPAQGNIDSEGLIATHRILVIEADAHTRQLVEFILTRANYEVLTAKDGREAQHYINEEKPVDLIVTGLTLPYVTGYQILLDAKQSSTWKRVPIIVLSGKVLEMDVVRALDTGANDYVTKPFRPRELLARIHRLLVTYEGVVRTG